MKVSFAKIAGVAGMAVLVAAAGLGLGAGTAQAKPKPVVPRPHNTTMITTNFFQGFRAFQTGVDGFVDSTYPNGEKSVVDPFSDLFTPFAK
jgi:hypothetical protein